jgi:HlyD family secretion protein
MTVSVNVEVSRREGVLRVPAEAVRGPGDDAWALVIAAGQAERRPLRVGLRGQGAVEVTAGLAEGEWVVPPSARLQPGARARPAPLAEPDRAL